jgi:hypothetical protein
VIADMEQAVQQQQNMDSKEFLYSLSANPSDGQVNIFVF